MVLTLELIHLHPTTPFSLIIEKVGRAGPTAADDLVDCTLKLAGVKSGFNFAEQTFSKTPFGRVLKNVSHQFNICRYTLINVHFQSTQHDCNQSMSVSHIAHEMG